MSHMSQLENSSWHPCCRFHWMRDAGLSAKAWMDVNNNDYASVREVMEGYASWTGIVQHKDDQYCDVRIRAVNKMPLFAGFLAAKAAPISRNVR